MHRYLKAAGFPDHMTERAVLDFLDREVFRPENLYTELRIDAETTAGEYRCMLSEHTGIAAVVLFVQGRQPVLSHYFPFYEPYDEPISELCSVDRHADREVYSGITDIPESGATLIFYIINSMDLRRKIASEEVPDREYRGIYLSAFADHGTVLLPVANGDLPRELTGRYDPEPEETGEYPEGDLPEMSLETQELYYMDEIRERAQREDLYSLVEQSFIPDGVECDQYSVIGEILQIEESVNRITGEPLLFILLMCNCVKFRVCMRKRDLHGDPQPGRRLKCGIWLQAHVNLEA